MAAIEAGDLVVLMEDAAPLLRRIAEEGGAAALAQVGVTDQDITNLVNEQAVEYADDRAAEMVGKRELSDGTLVDNPDAEWRIDDATRELIRADVSQAVDEGWSNDRLARELAGSYAFSEERAETIARTETAFADVAGNMSAYRASGLVSQKQWVAAADCCDECQDLDGEVVAIDDDFPGDGGDGPPLHPNCRCDVLPVLETSED